jgi:hypothetical protein
MSAGSHDGGRSKKKADSRRSIAARRRAAQRRSEIIRLAVIRRRNSISVDFGKFAYALASAIGSGTPGRYPVGSVGQWRTAPGLDVMSLADAMREAGFRSLDLSGVDGDRLANAIEDFHDLTGDPLHSGLSGAVLGRLLQLTAEERRRCDIRSIDATDETVADRRGRSRSAKLERDRERQRARRSGHHRTRHEYEAGSAARSRPWEAESVSRATYYRRMKSNSTECSEVATCATNLSQDARQEVASPATNLSHVSDGAASTGETSVSRTHEINRSGDIVVSRRQGGGHLARNGAAGVSPAAALSSDRTSQ